MSSSQKDNKDELGQQDEHNVQHEEQKDQNENQGEIQVEEKQCENIQRNEKGSKQSQDLHFSMKFDEHKNQEPKELLNQTSNLYSQNEQNSEIRARPSGREMFHISKQFEEDEKVVIYKDEFKDKLTMSPFKKYAKYGKFPFKLLIHLGLILFTSMQIEYTHSQFTPFSRQQDLQWMTLFYNDPDVATNNGIYTFYSIDDFQIHLNSLFINLSEYNEKYFQQINLKQANIFLEYGPEPIKKKDLFVKFQGYPIDPAIGITSPFNQHDKLSIKKFLGQTRNFNIQINNLSVTLAHENQPYSCWNFAIQYKFIATVFIQSILQADGKMCDDYMKVQHKFSEATILFKGSQVIVNSIILILALSSFFLGLKYIFDMIKDYMYFKKKGQILVPIVNKPKKKKVDEDCEEYLPDNLIQILHEQRPWDQLTFNEKRKYFDLWFIVIMFGNICQISSCLFIMLQDKHDNLVSRLSEPFRWLQGLGCTLAWLTALKYFDYFSRFNITSEIIKFSFPKIGKHFIGFIPILASFILVGMTSFGGSQRFATMRDSFATLFSLLLGDSINDITHDIEDNGVSRPLAVLYIVGFIIIFILSVNNVMIAIIQDEGARRREVVARDKEYKKMEKEKKKVAQLRKIEEKKLQQRLDSGENLEDITRKIDSKNTLNDTLSQSQNQTPQKTPKFVPFQLNPKEKSSSVDKNNGQFDTGFLDSSSKSQRKLDPEFMINRSHQDSMSSSQSIKDKKDGTIITNQSQLQNQQQQQQQQTSLIQSNNNLLHPVYEDLHESFVNREEEEQQKASKQQKQLLEQQQQQQSQIGSDQLFQHVLKQDNESEYNYSQNLSLSLEKGISEVSQMRQSQSLYRKSSNFMDQDQKSKISLKALTKVAIQMRKSKQNAQERIDLREQYREEVEMLTEQKINYKEYYKTFKNGFNKLIEIVDIQSFEIKDNLYLYQITREERADIITQFCDILIYFRTRTRLQ